MRWKFCLIKFLGKNWNRENTKFDSCKFKISIFQKLGFGKIRNQYAKTRMLICEEFQISKNKKSAPQNPKFNCDLDFLGPEFNFEKFSTSTSLVPLGFRFETPKSDFSVVENLQIYPFTSKFKFLFDRNLDFDLGHQTDCWGFLYSALPELAEKMNDFAEKCDSEFEKSRSA